MIRRPQHDTLIGGIRDRVPEGPGVYLFYGDRDEVLYIGKAVNLRQRMLNHLGTDPRADEPRHSRLIYEVRRFGHQSTASELLALLREDELIKKHRPRFNVRQNEFLECKYLELTTGDYPRLRMMDYMTDFGDRRVFGPYRDRYLVDRILQLIHHHLGLRSCADPDPVGKCLEFDLDHCAGPCRSGVTPQAYGRVVARSAAFLDGEVSEVASRLQREMERSSKRLEFERAQELKERLEFCHRFAERQGFLRAFKERKLTVVEQGDPGLTYLFLRGRLVAHGSSVEPVESKSGETALVPEGAVEDPRFLLDRAAIVHGWLRRNEGRCAHDFMDPDTIRIDQAGA